MKTNNTTAGVNTAAISFDSFNLDKRVAAGIPNEYKTPTSIQVQAIPVVLEGKDVLGLAQTGTGKTAAFVLPILNRLVQERVEEASTNRNHNHNRGHVLRTLILAPTRELVEQICESIRVLGAKTGLRCTAIYGGVSMNQQVQRLRQGVDIVVACPGRLLDHMQQRTIDLRRIEVLVLDEADQMFDMGFLPSIHRILKALPVNRQTLMFSATMPADVRHLANDVLKNPVTIQVGTRTPVSTVSHAVYVVEPARKSSLLLHILKETGPGSVLIFTRTKHGARRLGLTLARKGHDAASLQGDMSQRQRQDALDGFRDGRFQILVATDIAARGIDVQSVSHVINYDIPNTPEAYTHRIGRTGRAERTGDAFTLVTRSDFGMLRTIERTLGAPIQRRPIPEGLEMVANEPDPQDDRRERNFRSDGNGRGPDTRATGGRAPGGRGQGGRGPGGRAPRGDNRKFGGRSTDRRGSQQRFAGGARRAEDRAIA